MKKAKITHFISPYIFYFKYDLSEKENEYIEVLEKAISAHVKEHLRERPSTEYRFKVGDLVSLYYLPWKRFLRSQVLEVLEKFSLPTDYIVWAHDYGFPVQTGEMFLIPLPHTFKEVESLVHRGCLADVIPVNIMSENLSKPEETKQATEWSIQTSEELALMLDKREIFIEIIDEHYMRNDSLQFCKVEVEITGNEYVDVVELLESFQFGVRVEPNEFVRLLSKFSLRNNVDWVNNDGSPNFCINEDHQCNLPLLLQDWEKQPPFDIEIIEANVEENLKQQLHLPPAKDPKQTQFPKCCLAHSSLLLSKRKLEEVINAGMCSEIFRMGITSYNILQKYSWPHLQRGNSLFVISPSGNGKKWCYLPVICNIVEMTGKNLPKQYGLPLSIIVTANKSISMEIAMISRQLLQNVKINSKDLVRVGQVNSMEDIFQFVGILIITTEDISKMMVNGVFKQLFYDKRLYAIVLNNITEMLQQENEAFLENLITHCRTVKENVKVDQRCIQMIVTANEWHELVSPTIINTIYYPLLLMSDFLEAAVYARCPIVTKLCRNTDKKLNIIAGFIQKHQSLRTVVVCSTENEALIVDKALNRSGLCSFSYTKNEYANVLLNCWKNLISNEVLICTDADVLKLSFNKVDKLVHYSLPTAWSTFTQRFSVMKDAYLNFIELGLTPDKYAHRDGVVSSFITLGTDDLHLLPQLKTFLIKYKQPLPENLLDYECRANDPVNVPKELVLAAIEPDIISAQSTFKIRWAKLYALTEVILGDIEDLYNFYVRLTSSKHVEKLATLEHFISEQTFSATCTINELHNTGYYLVSYMNKLARAQLQQLRREGRSSFYRFFLVDFANFIDIPFDGEKTIKNVYPITRNIIEFTACQSVHCKPAGFEMKPDSSFCNNLYRCGQLYAYPCRLAGRLVNNLHVNSYHIKLFQYEDDADKKNYTYTGDKKGLSS